MANPVKRKILPRSPAIRKNTDHPENFHLLGADNGHVVSRAMPIWISKNGQLWLRLIHRSTLSSFQIRVELLLPDRTPLSAAETEALLVTAVSFSLFFHSLSKRTNSFIAGKNSGGKNENATRAGAT